jgi:hypothetical protein
MRTVLLLIAAVALAGCDKPSSKDAAAPPPQDPIGRWAIVPVSGAALHDAQQYLYFAWRIDTVTGSLEMCTFDPGGWKVPTAPGGIAPQALDCTQPVAAIPSK